MNESYDFILNDNNDTNATNWNVSHLNIEDQMDEGPSEQMPLSVTLLFIVAGTIGNCLVCLAILLDGKLQNLTNYFLLSLAVTDLIVSLVILPARLLTERYEFYPSTFSLCFLYLVGDDFVTAASYVHICFISFERYFAIKEPLKQRNIPKKRVAVKIGLVWVIAFLFIIPYMTLAIITEHPNQPTYCDVLLSNFVYYDGIILTEALVYIIMIVVVIVTFILTTRLLYGLAKKQEQNIALNDFGLIRTVGVKITDDKSNTKKVMQALQTEKKALKVVWLVSFAFIICMTPYSCTGIFYLAFPDIIMPPVLLEIAVYFNYLNSVINPILYTVFNKTFRNDFKNLILFKYQKVGQNERR